MKQCSVDGCERRHKCLGLCDTHYSRYKRTGVRGGEIAERGRRGNPCSNAGCLRGQYSLGYCQRCYYRLSRYGDPNGGKFQKREGSPRERFFACLPADPLPDQCWEWQGRLRPDGYGGIDHPYSQLAHRVAWMEFVSHVPDGLAIHHTCANRSCVNPSHLAPVTYASNTAEMLERTYYKRRIAELEAQLAEQPPKETE